VLDQPPNVFLRALTARRCTANTNGGALVVDSPVSIRLTLSGATFDQCRAAEDGGALAVYAPQGFLELQGVFITNSIAAIKGGGAMLESSSNITWSGGALLNNTAGGEPGGPHTRTEPWGARVLGCHAGGHRAIMGKGERGRDSSDLALATLWPSSALSVQPLAPDPAPSQSYEAT